MFAVAIASVIIIWAFLHTISYGIWEWKKKRKLGAVAVFVLALVLLALPIYTVFYRT